MKWLSASTTVRCVVGIVLSALACVAQAAYLSFTITTPLASLQHTSETVNGVVDEHLVFTTSAPGAPQLPLFGLADGDSVRIRVVFEETFQFLLGPPFADPTIVLATSGMVGGGAPSSASGFTFTLLDAALAPLLSGSEPKGSGASYLRGVTILEDASIFEPATYLSIGGVEMLFSDWTNFGAPVEGSGASFEIHNARFGAPWNLTPPTPVVEPGTLALALMGLLLVGVSIVRCQYLMASDGRGPTVFE